MASPGDDRILVAIEEQVAALVPVETDFFGLVWEETGYPEALLCR
jgi:hypothetical protein